MLIRAACLSGFFFFLIRRTDLAILISTAVGSILINCDLLNLDTFGRPVAGRREQRGYSATSDQGTGDEATLPRTEERPAKKKSGIRRSRSTTRNQSTTPNVPAEVHKKQLFPRGRSGKERGGEGRGAEGLLFTRIF